ncbi:hypothetical protein CAEBREN_28619 [Caenorhabditis brenneri]|uniref:Uncharacterized protein n=1 Tax=Caenorhabditis brenneri TaxID=135651 RepID=G0PGU7_CAEBE|nr:hypothetical protein CAEBREN_28619 [Caenorhabditis brenneri]
MNLRNKCDVISNGRTMKGNISQVQPEITVTLSPYFHSSLLFPPLSMHLLSSSPLPSTRPNNSSSPPSSSSLHCLCIHTHIDAK